MTTPRQSSECFALRGQTMIDIIDSETGLTHIYRKSLEQCRAERPEYANAERMTIEEYCQSKAAVQDSPITWEPTTEDRYMEMLEVLPPAAIRAGGFLVGEPFDHHALTGEPRYQAFRQQGNQFSVSSRPMTTREFRQ